MSKLILVVRFEFRRAATYTSFLFIGRVLVSTREDAMADTAWQDVYKEALLEVDPIKLPQRVEAAHRAIRKRLTENDEPLSKREFDDIDGALRILQFLTREAA